MNIDNFKVIHHASRPSYTLFKKYLIFLNIDSVKRTGVQTFGARGVFVVDSQRLLKSTTSGYNALEEYILKHHKNSLDLLRGDIQMRVLAKK